MAVDRPVSPGLSLPSGNVIYFSGITSILADEGVGEVYEIFYPCFLCPRNCARFKVLREHDRSSSSIQGVQFVEDTDILWKITCINGLMRVVTGN